MVGEGRVEERRVGQGWWVWVCVFEGGVWKARVGDVRLL